MKHRRAGSSHSVPGGKRPSAGWFSCHIITRQGLFYVFFFNDPPPTEISPLSLPDALPIPHGLHPALMRPLAPRPAQLHGALAAASSDPAFAPEPISAEDLGAWSRATRAAATATLQMLAERAAALPPAAAAEAVTLLAQRAALLRSIGTVDRKSTRLN